MNEVNNCKIELLENVECNSNEHIKSHNSPDTLFRFMRKFEYLKSIIENKCLFSRYFNENVKYLNLVGIESLTYPMTCFCDINLHRIKQHIGDYGEYGIAFSKKWAMDNKIQPVQYINPNSDLRIDITSAFNSFLALEKKLPDDNIAANFFLRYLMFIKPYSGKIIVDDKEKDKCFEDESEWRFVPEIPSTSSFKQIYTNDEMVNLFDVLNEALTTIDSIKLNFEYSDIKYIILEKKSDLTDFIIFLNELVHSKKLELTDKEILLTKIIILNEQLEDF